MWKSIIHLATISLFGTLADIANGDSVEFHRAVPPQAPFTAPSLGISPSFPTTLDVISFTTPLDIRVYSNSCFAGSIGISRDELNSVIHIRHQGLPPNIACITLFDPVIGAEGSFGPLDAGDWVLRDSHNNELKFLVSGIVREPNDCSGDGILGAEDFGCVSTIQQRDAVLAALNTFPGDFDGISGVAFADFLMLSSNFGKVGLPYSEGNIDLVDDVSFRDFQTLARNFGKGGGAAAAAIPEPSSLTLICLAGFLTEFVRKRRLAFCW